MGEGPHQEGPPGQDAQVHLLRPPDQAQGRPCPAHPEDPRGPQEAAAATAAGCQRFQINSKGGAKSPKTVTLSDFDKFIQQTLLSSKQISDEASLKLQEVPFVLYILSVWKEGLKEGSKSIPGGCLEMTSLA